MIKNYFPPNHRHTGREKAIIAGLSRTWSAIAPDTGDVPKRDLHSFLFDCYVEMYSRMCKEDLDAWHELCTAKVGSADYRLATKIAKMVVS